MKTICILFLLALMSCKKHSCVCTDSNGTTTNIGAVHGTKKQAKKACEQLMAGSSTTSCKLN